MKGYVSVRDAARLKGVGVGAVLLAIKEGRLCAERLNGRAWAIPTETLADYHPAPSAAERAAMGGRAAKAARAKLEAGDGS